jgi:hypothetical protein
MAVFLGARGHHLGPPASQALYEPIVWRVRPGDHLVGVGPHALVGFVPRVADRS